jgi:hypothetical protein
MADRSIELIKQLDQELRGLEDQHLRKLRGIFDEALRRTIRSLMDRLERIEAQPDYDPASTPGAFLGSTPDGPVPITPLQKNQASLYLQGQLAQDLQAIINRFPADRAANAALNRELTELYNKAQDLGTEYAHELSRDMLPPAAVLSSRHPSLQDPQLPPAAPPAPTDAPAPGSPYQEGQSFTRLLNLGAVIAASERDFKTLSANYRRQRNAATSDRVWASKDYFFRWWRDWGDAVQFETATQMATGVDSRALARNLKARLPHINDAFRNRAETVARTETHIAAGEARERTFRRVGAGFVRYVATADDRVCEFCAPRMGALYYAGSVKTPIHPNCVLPGTEVLPGHLIAATRMVYRGDVVTIRTKAGRSLACTRHHLVATTRGWVAAQALNRGDQVLTQALGVQTVMANPDLATTPALIEDLFQATLATSKMPPVSVPVAPVHFHGDGAAAEGQVDVVWADRELMEHLVAGGQQQPGDLPLIAADTQRPLEASLSAQDLALLTFHAALGGLVSRRDLCCALLGGHLHPSELVRLAGISWRDPRFDQPVLDGPAADVEMVGELVGACPGLVTADEILDIKIDPAGHDGFVYDLTTFSGMYVANGILTHNCRCSLSPITLESLVIQNQLAANRGERWEDQQQALAAATRKKYDEASSRPWRPIGGTGEPRGPRDYPLMERTALPATTPRPNTENNPANGGARPWPSGDPVWTPSRGWINAAAREAYEAMVIEVAELEV